MNLNKVFLIGRVVKDIELRVTPQGQSVASFPLATNRVWNDKMGQKQEETEFHNVVVWGRQAETCKQYVQKGKLLMIEGRIKTRSWDAPTGERKYRTEVIADRVQFGPKSGDQEQFSRPQGKSDYSQDAPLQEDVPILDIADETVPTGEDLPF
ncbi:MAG: hypothetical protein A2418_03150 [Candidatus Brennerbacteria bacterium RIFOXYC1_FULL_41_11]|nr:MAG: hypothetical protein A2418_03150 [Candidatus Brennerbacteria bacterium RIFOXYC1_FULL_41_11]